MTTIAQRAVWPEPMDRDLFLRTLLDKLAGTLEEVVGLEEAAGYIGIVGREVGSEVAATYRQAAGDLPLTPEQVAQVLVDFKARIEGGFSVESVDTERIVLRNTRCPFGERVLGHTSLCMMTTSVFGVVAAENLGYARVDIEEAIARGDAGCRVVVTLEPHVASAPSGPEFYRTR